MGCFMLTKGSGGISCTQICEKSGLKCVAAFEEVSNSCEAEETWTCDQTEGSDGGTTSDMICECGSSEDGKSAEPEDSEESEESAESQDSEESEETDNDSKRRGRDSNETEDDDPCANVGDDD